MLKIVKEDIDSNHKTLRKILKKLNEKQPIEIKVRAVKDFPDYPSKYMVFVNYNKYGIEKYDKPVSDKFINKSDAVEYAVKYAKNLEELWFGDDATDLNLEQEGIH